MWTRLTPFDRTLAWMNEWRRQMDRAFPDSEGPFFFPVGAADESWSLSEATWPRVSLHDTGTGFLLLAEAPGIHEKDLQIQLENDILTLSGERRTEVPEGYTSHRRERGSLSFTRSFTLPAKVDAERVNATLKDGVLQIEMPKSPEAQPRQISVRASA